MILALKAKKNCNLTKRFVFFCGLSAGNYRIEFPFSKSNRRNAPVLEKSRSGIANILSMRCCWIASIIDRISCCSAFFKFISNIQPRTVAAVAWISSFLLETRCPPHNQMFNSLRLFELREIPFQLWSPDLSPSKILVISHTHTLIFFWKEKKWGIKNF